MKKNDSLMDQSKVELIDSALLKVVAGAGCEGEWVEDCGTDHGDWCGYWSGASN